MLAAASLGLACAPVWAQSAKPAPGEARQQAEADLLRAAQLWVHKQRTDMARQLIAKLLAVAPDSAEGLAALGDIALRENQPEEARRILQQLRTLHPTHRRTAELETLARVLGADREKLARMRLLARAGRKSEAAELAQELFPNGPPQLGGLALEYHQIMGSLPGQRPEAMRQLDRLFRETAEPRYRLALLEMQMYEGRPLTAVLGDLQALADRPDVNQQLLRDLWRRALDRLDNRAATVPLVRAYLRHYPDDAAAIERLAAAQQALERAERAARDPANLARAAARQAVEQGNTELAEEKLLEVLALRPRDAESLGELGLIRLRQGNHREAQELFAAAFAQNPSDRWKQLRATARFWGLLRQADRAVEQQEFAVAAELALKARALQPDNAEALVALADIRVLQSLPDDAEGLYQAALAAEPDHRGALKGLASLYARSGRAPEALALLERAARQDPALAGQLATTRASILRDQAAQHIEARRFSAAMRDLESAVALDPDNPWLRHSLARLYLRLELAGEAQSVMNDGIALQPQDAEMRYARALIRSAIDDEAGALADLAAIPAAQRSASMNALAQQAMVRTLIRSATQASDAGAAQVQLARAEAEASNDPELLLEVANAWFRRAAPEAGVAVYDRLAARNPALPPEVRLNHASLLNRAGQDTALAALLDPLLQHPQWTPAQQDRLIAIYTDHRERLITQQRTAGRATEAIQLARASVSNAQAPALKGDRRNAARLWLAAGEYAEAAQLLSEAAQARPDDLDIRLDLADARYRLGQLDPARSDASWLSSRIPLSDTARSLALLRLWQRLDAFSEARALSEKLVRSAPEDADVLLHAARLERADRNYAQAVAFFRRALRIEQLSGSRLARIEQDGPPPSGTAQEEPPLQLKKSYSLSALADNPATIRILQDIDAIEARRQAWIETGVQRLHKSATEGVSLRCAAGSNPPWHGCRVATTATISCTSTGSR